MAHWIFAVEADDLQKFDNYINSIVFDDSERKQAFIDAGVVPPENVRPVIRELKFYDVRLPKTCEDQFHSWTVECFPYGRINKFQAMVSRITNTRLFKWLFPGFSLIPRHPKKLYPPFKNPRSAGQAMMIPLMRVDDNDDMFGI
jgi:hypothetical protein